MIYIKGKIKDYASNQSDLDKTNDLSKSALDRSSRSILDEYQQKFENNQAILQGYIDVLKGLSEKVSSIGDSVQKQYEWLRNQDFIPATEGGQEALDDIGEKLCQTMGDDGSGNPGCNVTLEQIDDFTDCIATGDGSGCHDTCDSHIQMCVDAGEGSCQTACESVCQDICESQCQAATEGTCDTPIQAACGLVEFDEDYCVPSDKDENCTSYGQDNWCGLMQTDCYQVVDAMSCVTLGDYSGEECYDVGETSCVYLGEKYCTASGEQYCNVTGELNCLFLGEKHCIFEGEDDWFCNTTVDEYMCDNSADGPDACYDVGEANCKYSGEKYCRESGEKFYCFFYEDNACTSIGDQELICKYYDDESYSWCEQEVVDSCGIPFKDCSNSAVCPPEYGQNAGCDAQGCPAICNDSCISTCDSNCFKGCNQSCTSYCDTGCEQHCNGDCNETCISTCDTNCFNGCNKNCEKSCVAFCDVSCFGVCVSSCDKVCFGTCITTCDSSCFAGCNKSCTSYCDTGCEQICDSNCYSGCNKSCTSYCDAGCDTSCFKGCNDECTGYSCDSYCDANFQCTGCDGTAPCMAACIPSQETCTQCGEEGGQCQAGRWCTAPVK